MRTLLAKLLGLPNFLWNFYAPVLRQLVVTGVAQLLPLALEIVRSLAQTDKSGAEKRDAAISSLREAALTQGVVATESLLRWTVESAVQRLKLEE